MSGRTRGSQRGVSSSAKSHLLELVKCSPFFATQQRIHKPNVTFYVILFCLIRFFQLFLNEHELSLQWLWRVFSCTLIACLHCRYTKYVAAIYGMSSIFSSHFWCRIITVSYFRVSVPFSFPSHRSYGARIECSLRPPRSGKWFLLRDNKSAAPGPTPAPASGFSQHWAEFAPTLNSLESIPRPPVSCVVWAWNVPRSVSVTPNPICRTAKIIRSGSKKDAGKEKHGPTTDQRDDAANFLNAGRTRPH